VILVISTSHPVASFAVIDGEDVVLAGQRLAPRAASAACLEMLADVDLDKIDEGFIADVGPGSFTGVKVGVTMVKMLAWLFQLPVAGATSFDLISIDEPVRVASKKGEYWRRQPGCEPELLRDPNFDPGSLPPPLAERARYLTGSIKWIAPEILVPDYLAEPSISKPNRPYREAPTCP